MEGVLEELLLELDEWGLAPRDRRVERAMVLSYESVTQRLNSIGQTVDKLRWTMTATGKHAGVLEVANRVSRHLNGEAHQLMANITTLVEEATILATLCSYATVKEEVSE